MSDEHVRSDIRKYLSSNIDTRIALIHQEIWVNNNSSAAVFRMMNNIADVPDRMSAPALLVVGPGGSGKTGRRQKLSATPDLSGRVLPCLITNSALKNAPISRSVCCVA
ncbi:TniB family NTP-binding protein [Pseudomonas aeruginosa]|uniref:TniB family NTP-binding protein n=1 Tax=Pseudomonas aeruginosa TaxID=287 RepID=UPI004046E291